MKPPRSDKPRGARPGSKPYAKPHAGAPTGRPGRPDGSRDSRAEGRPGKPGFGSSHATGAERPRRPEAASPRGPRTEGARGTGPKREVSREMSREAERDPNREPSRGPRREVGRDPHREAPRARAAREPDRDLRPAATVSSRGSSADAEPSRIRDHAREGLSRESREREMHFTPRAPRPAEAPRGAVWLYGQHAVEAALANPLRRLRRLVITEEATATLAERLPQPWNIQPETVARERIDHILGRDAVHQGIALLADLLPQITVGEALERSGPILVLDQVTDPRNIGAILRSAAAFGAAAVILQERHAPEETGSLAKAASGALESVPLLRAVNLARTITLLKAGNCWVVGLDAEARQPLRGPAFAERRVALVLGGEGEGLRRLTRESCDELAMLPMPGAMESLNVSAACAVALYELGRKE